MADKPVAAEGAKAPAKSKKLMIVIGAVVLVLVLGGAGAFFYISKQRAAAEAADDGGDAPAKAVVKDEHATPPAYLPMDNMVVNLADPGGERVAQVGITLVVADAHVAETVKAFLPTIRSGVLMLISQRSSDELLKTEGKQQLKKDILREASLPFGGGDDDPDEATNDSGTKKKKKKKAAPEYPVTDVLFSSFIVQ